MDGSFDIELGVCAEFVQTNNEVGQESVQQVEELRQVVIEPRGRLENEVDDLPISLKNRDLDGVDLSVNFHKPRGANHTFLELLWSLQGQEQNLPQQVC